jgi:hypothetical protein
MRVMAVVYEPCTYPVVGVRVTGYWSRSAAGGSWSARTRTDRSRCHQEDSSAGRWPPMRSRWGFNLC